MFSPYFDNRFRLLIASGLLLCSVTMGGCGYVVGGPYSEHIHTVHVPTFTNETFRRGYETQLTEAVHKQIQLRTPYRLTKGNGADSRLTGRIINIDKRVENQNKFDDPRELELSIAVELVWEDLRNGQILAQQRVPLNAQTTNLIVNTSFAPEPGQSLATASQDAFNQIARQVVGLMEVPW